MCVYIYTNNILPRSDVTGWPLCAAHDCLCFFLCFDLFDFTVASHSKTVRSM